MDDGMQDIFEAILGGDAYLTKKKVQAALDTNIEPSAILNVGVIAAMAEAG